MKSLEEKYKKVVIPEMKKKFGYPNSMQVPKITKVVLSSGTGSFKDETKKTLVEKSLTEISGQKPMVNKAKKSIASFKLRQGMPIGYSVNLRGKRMYDFLNKFINVTIPRIRDFRGLDPKFIDQTGNLSVGLKEHIAFPEAAGEDVRSAFGLGVTVVTTAKNKEESLELLKFLGFPFSPKIN